MFYIGNLWDSIDIVYMVMCRTTNIYDLFQLLSFNACRTLKAFYLKFFTHGHRAPPLPSEKEIPLLDNCGYMC